MMTQDKRIGFGYYFLLTVVIVLNLAIVKNRNFPRSLRTDRI